MKIFLLIMVSLFLVPGISTCGPGGSSGLEAVQTPVDNENLIKDDNPVENPSTSNRMKISVGSITFTATLDDNGTARKFKAMLPMTMSMAEHAGNEKYYDLPGSLPTAAYNPGTIRNGDIMLFGSRTLVLFYKTFSTPYGYTRIGSVDDPSGLAQALGTGDATVTFGFTE